MGKGSKSGGRPASHQKFKDKAKTRVDDLQGMFTDLQSARKESRTTDVAVLEEQVNQMLREWKSELNEASPASSLLGSNLVSSDLSSEIRRLLQLNEDQGLLQLNEEQDDATSKPYDLPLLSPKPEPLDAPNADAGGMQGGANAFFEEYLDIGGGEYHDVAVNCSGGGGSAHLDFEQYNLQQEVGPNQYIGYDCSGRNAEHHLSDLLSTMCPPACAFLKPKCALWDCSRPAQGSEWCEDYCSSFHATLALNEGPPGMAPVLRPGGIDLKDGPLFAALGAKTQGKNVGIPDCEGAATKKSPWNAPDLFDLYVLEGETLREWLFFDKPRKAFESGSRKQRSLPDYKGRGWHESRKQVMKEFGGLKRSYYMDPQPSDFLEWHLYEYEINDSVAWALYRLELKLVLDSKKSVRVKIASDSVVDLQQQMGRLNAEGSGENKRCVKVRAKNTSLDNTDKFSPASETEDAQNLYAANQTDGTSAYGPSFPCAYSVEGLSDYYGT